MEAGTDVNACSPNGSTALYDATTRGQLEVMRILLEHGADPNATDNHNSTPLQMARGAAKEELGKPLEGK